MNRESRARPAHTCACLLAALEASEGRRRRRKRDTTPDSIGLGIKRELLERAVRDDPEPEEFEGWLLAQCEASPAASGPVQAMASAILEEWRLAQRSEAFRGWLESGAESEDKKDPERSPSPDSRDGLDCEIPRVLQGRGGNVQ